MSSAVPAPPLWTAKDAATATAGQYTEDWLATGVSIDSRSLRPGDLFVALAGPKFDGHDFAAAALAAGAAAAVVSRVPQHLPSQAPQLIVTDTLAALKNLGAGARLRTSAVVLAVTGSFGKTSCKEMLRAGITSMGKVHASEGNLNNHCGVPLSLARMPRNTEFAVFELGMNHAGEITDLAQQVKPDVALITGIGPAHLEFFLSVDEISDAKAEIFSAMTPSGQAVINGDSEQTPRLTAAAQGFGLQRIWTFGTRPDADARLIACITDADGTSVEAIIAGNRLTYRLGLAGRHQAVNSVGVLMAIHAAGGDTTKAASALALVHPLKGRGKQLYLNSSDGGRFTLIDESYNANPAAMEAALSVLATSQPSSGGRRVAVLGDMVELGKQSDQLHASLAAPIGKAGVDKVYLCGSHMHKLWQQLPSDIRGQHVDSASEMAAIAPAAIQAGDIVLVKGSLGTRMSLVVEALTNQKSPLVDSGSPLTITQAGWKG